MSNYLPEQADLNWWNPELRDEFERILRFWFDRVAGFRIDVAHMLVKDRELRDNPPATEDDQFIEQLRGSASSTTRTGPRCTRCTAAGG